MKTAKIITTFLISAIYIQFVGCQSVQEPTLEEKVAQMVMVGFRGCELSENQQIKNDIQNLKIGGVVLFEYDVPSGSRPRNIASPQQLQQLCNDLQNLSKTPLLIAIDQEGGMVNRLKERYGFPKTVSQQYLGELNNGDSTKTYARQTALQLKQLGFNLNFAPCVDVNVNPDCPVIGKIGRSFSSDNEIVAKHAAMMVEEFRQEGVKTCIKHFPGHGSAKSDSHYGFTDISETWQTAELVPYKKLINSHFCDAIMTGHVFLAQKDSIYPATLSKNIVQHLLRDTLNWNGVVFSDDMNMEAITKNFGFEESIVLAINAGVDILVFSNNSKAGYDEHLAQKIIKAIVSAIKTGEIDEERIDESYQRIVRMKND